MVSSGLGLNSWRCGFCVCWFHCQRCGAVLTCGTRDPSGDQSGAGAAVSVSSVRKVFGVLLTSRSAHSSSGWARQFTNPFLGPFSWAPPRLQPPQDSLSASLGFPFSTLWSESWAIVLATLLTAPVLGFRLWRAKLTLFGVTAFWSVCYSLPFRVSM